MRDGKKDKPAPSKRRKSCASLGGEKRKLRLRERISHGFLSEKTLQWEGKGSFDPF